LGIYPKECNSGYNKGTCIAIFITALFTIAKLCKQPRCPKTGGEEAKRKIQEMPQCTPDPFVWFQTFRPALQPFGED
jgi:hypothetical protein